MITIKELIKTPNSNCIEVTWVETIEEVETTIKCHTYADVQMDMLRADAEKYKTSLVEYQDIIAEVESKAVYPTTEEIEAQELLHKIQEAEYYLASTDWVKDYKLRNDLGLEVIPEDSSKWLIIAKREEYISFLRDNK